MKFEMGNKELISFIYRKKNKTVKQKLKYKFANIATFKLNTDIYYLEYTHF